eukprot:TRINITY_DN4714_c0_g1_i1.p1 TRINITY_DN4714_c0_g1~~TRINITY_DN4714_c0_g1_i1.p1  ORF type:complete len:449 (-),score=-32.46 TRINITY_DN4714_c0_g1_i1:359-1705(-)
MFDKSGIPFFSSLHIWLEDAERQSFDPSTNMCFKPSPVKLSTSRSQPKSSRKTSRNLQDSQDNNNNNSGQAGGSKSRSTDLSGPASSQQSKLSSTSSTSSSLASVRESLPENPNLYRFRELSDSTSQFSAGKLGRSAWKCVLRGRDVVVTARPLRRSISAASDLRAPLRDICSAHHRSVVPLIGACYEPERGQTLYLVYDRVTGSSLSDCLHGSRLPAYTVLSTWLSRMQIAVDVAQGLEYLHHDSSVDYIHNCLKPSAILVMEPEFRAKICHFGASYLAGEYQPRSQSDHMTLRRTGSNKIMGTQGYMAPEIKLFGSISQAGDVYAFGIILLELLSGREPVRYVADSGKRVALVDSVWEVLQGEGWNLGSRLRQWMDPRLKDSFPVDCAERVSVIAASCVDPSPEKRPDMRFVAGEMSAVFLQSEKWAKNMAANRGDISTSIAVQGR